MEVPVTGDSKLCYYFSMTNTGGRSTWRQGREGERGGGSEMVLPTLVVTVRRGFPSDDALLGISFRTMATVLSAALESFPYNSEINNDLCQDSWTTQCFCPLSRASYRKDFTIMMMENTTWGCLR